MSELERLKNYLFEHCYGQARGQKMADIALALGRCSRELRYLVQELRLRGCPICAHPNTGYYWAETPEELEVALGFLRGRALCSLRQVARLQRHALPLLAGQLVIGELPPVPEGAPGAEYGGLVALEVALPYTLHERVEAYLENRFWLSQDDLIRQAVAQFLALQGVVLPPNLLAELAEEIIEGELIHE
ncbi:hypothetical protein [Synechococcus sp. PCC 6312]|uniref:hypothetical protein n=1 Tax=Synechococcus sp. (strain ATCC 27167 / PCC 6312) TaxID=195253 RepID=UPI00029EF93D|nr:hypothetical protein [Synechococcus sp. PCC 6312]AFY60330.1 hypothetical protein Syn6312_1141 [Synechococcus sp. PCC 6312]